MLHFLSTNWLRDEDSPALLPSQKTAQSLLLSTIADGDVVTDWLYYIDIINSDEDIPQWLLILHLVTCICGTLSWLGVATDGRLVYWIKAVILWTFFIVTYIISVLLSISTHIIMESIGCCFGRDNKISNWIEEYIIDWIEYHVEQNALSSLKESAKQKPSFSSGTLLLFGILVEDIPQLVVTFHIEDMIRSDDPRGRISGTAMVNLTFAIFDILHKLAEAYDLQSDVLNYGYAYMSRIKAHSTDTIHRMANASKHQIMTISQGEFYTDMKVKLWATTKGKLKSIRSFKCKSSINDVIAVGSSKVIVTYGSNYNIIDMFDWKTGDFCESPLALGFQPRFICASHDSKTLLACGSYTSTFIQSFDVETFVPLSTYNRVSTTFAFLDNDTFVSSGSDNTAYVWNLDNAEPIHTIDLGNGHENGKQVIVLSPTIFLIQSYDSIKSFEFFNNEWTFKSTFKGHAKEILSLTKVNESLFVSTSWDKTAKLWDINKNPPCVFTFLGHKTAIYSSVFLDEEKAIATGDEKGNVFMWSIETHLENNQEEDNTENGASASEVNNTANNVNADQAEP